MRFQIVASQTYQRRSMRRMVLSGSIGTGLTIFDPHDRLFDELVEGVAVGLEFFVRKTGIVQMGEAEVALEAASAAIHRFQIGEHEVVSIGGGEKRALLDRLTARRTGGDPLLHRGNLCFAGTGLLIGRRHGAIVETLEEPARGRVAGDDFLPRHEFAEIGNVVEPALDRAVLPVAAIAMRLEDGLGFGREGLGIVGRPRVPRGKEHEYRGQGEDSCGHRARLRKRGASYYLTYQTREAIATAEV